jgi:hypothetical protein
VAVKSQWEACSLVASPFASAWKDFGDIMMWPQKVLEIQEAVVGHEDEVGSENLAEFPRTATVPVTVNSVDGVR